jgi:hypothetical protein
MRCDEVKLGDELVSKSTRELGVVVGIQPQGFQIKYPNMPAVVLHPPANLLDKNGKSLSGIMPYRWESSHCQDCNTAVVDFPHLCPVPQPKDSTPLSLTVETVPWDTNPNDPVRRRWLLHGRFSSNNLKEDQVAIETYLYVPVFPRRAVPLNPGKRYRITIEEIP